jgi:hypothetical protein
MTTRFTANLVLGCAISAMVAGCTVHTYSARPEYASAAFVSHEPARYQASFGTERSRNRATYRPANYRPAKADVRDRTTSNDRDSSRRDTESESSAKPARHVSSKPSRKESAAHKPSTGEKNEGHVELMPEKTKPEKKRSLVLSFRERLAGYVDKTNEEVAQRERERRKRMASAIGAAADKHD